MRACSGASIPFPLHRVKLGGVWVPVCFFAIGHRIRVIFDIDFKGHFVQEIDSLRTSLSWVFSRIKEVAYWLGMPSMTPNFRPNQTKKGAHRGM